MRNLASLAWLALVLAGLVGPLPAGAQPLPLYSLPDPNTSGIDNDQFGTALAIGGGLLVGGVPLADESATVTRAGAAYVFDVRTGQQRLKLTKPLAVDDDRAGAAVAVVGSPTAPRATGPTLGPSSSSMRRPGLSCARSPRPCSMQTRISVPRSPPSAARCSPWAPLATRSPAGPAAWRAGPSTSSTSPAPPRRRPSPSRNRMPTTSSARRSRR